MKVNIGNLLYKPETEVQTVDIMDRTYAKFINSPNVYVVSSIDKKDSNIEFELDGIRYKLDDCEYTEVDGNTHIECRYWSQEYIDC